MLIPVKSKNMAHVLINHKTLNVKHKGEKGISELLIWDRWKKNKQGCCAKAIIH